MYINERSPLFTKMAMWNTNRRENWSGYAARLTTHHMRWAELERVYRDTAIQLDLGLVLVLLLCFRVGFCSSYFYTHLVPEAVHVYWCDSDFRKLTCFYVVVSHAAIRGAGWADTQRRRRLPVETTSQVSCSSLVRVVTVHYAGMTLQ